MTNQMQLQKVPVKRRGGAKTGRCWSRSVGEHGYTVRLFEVYPGSRLYRSVWVAGTGGKPGREDRRTLGHKDKKRAVAQAHELIAHLRAAEGVLEQDQVTLNALLAQYLASDAHKAKAERTRREDERKLRRVAAFLGPERKAMSLGREDVLRFTAARRAGAPGLLRLKSGKPVRNRAIEADLVALRTMLNWARGQKNAHGVTLLSSNPLHGVAFPRELSPRRPSLRREDLRVLLDVAPRVSPFLHAALIVADGTGRRLSAWRRLRWRDVNFAFGRFGGICWPEETDKTKRRMHRPITEAVRHALLSLHPPGAQSSDWIFPHPGNDARPCSRKKLDDLLRDAYDLAGITPEEGGLWHPFRRGWVNARKHFPLKDLAAAGGWKSLLTLMHCYLQEDEETIERVILNPSPDSPPVAF